jgi:hypothetical protein
MTYAHARLCIAIHFKIEYWPLPKLAKGIRELRTVNHSLNFVDPNTGVHTQHIKWYWNKCKGRFKALHGTTIGKLLSYLDEFM